MDERTESGAAGISAATPREADAAVSAADWKAGLPGELRADPTLEKFNTLEGLARSYVNAQQLIGRDKIPMPRTDEELRRVFARLGMPEDPAGYRLELPASLPEGLSTVADEGEWFRESAHRHGLTEKQAAGIFEDYFSNLAGQFGQHMDSVSSRLDDAEAELAAEYGEKYGYMKELGNRAVEEFGGAELVDLMAETGLGTDPRFVKLFINIGQRMAEDSELIGKGEQAGMTPDDINAKISELMGRPGYLDRSSPEHKSLVRRVMDLRERLNAGGRA